MASPWRQPLPCASRILQLAVATSTCCADQRPSRNGETFSSSMHDKSMSRYAEWLKRECDVKELDNFRLAEFDHGYMDNASSTRYPLYVRGLGFTRELAQNEPLACIPSKCWLSVEAHQDNAMHPSAKIILEQLHQDKAGKGANRFAQKKVCDDVGTLSLFVAEEMKKGQESWWYPFINTLPSADVLRTFHMAYFREEMKRVFGADVVSSKEPVRDAALEKLTPDERLLLDLGTKSNWWPLWEKELKGCYKAYRAYNQAELKEKESNAGMLQKLWSTPSVPSHKNFTFAELKLARVHVVGRYFGRPGLVPLVDLLNTVGKQHNCGKTYRGEKKDNLCLYTKQPVRQGGELLTSYALEKQSYSVSLNQYGFALYHEEGYARSEHTFSPNDADRCDQLMTELLQPNKELYEKLRAWRDWQPSDSEGRADGSLALPPSYASSQKEGPVLPAMGLIKSLIRFIVGFCGDVEGLKEEFEDKQWGPEGPPWKRKKKTEL